MTEIEYEKGIWWQRKPKSNERQESFKRDLIELTFAWYLIFNLAIGATAPFYYPNSSKEEIEPKLNQRVTYKGKELSIEDILTSDLPFWDKVAGVETNILLAINDVGFRPGRELGYMARGGVYEIRDRTN